MMIKDIGLPSGTTYDLGDKRVGNYIRSYSDTEVSEQSGTALTQTSAKYLVSDSEISSYVDGMVVIFTITASSDIDYGSAFQINNLGWHPIIHGPDGKVSSSRYPIGTKVIMVYNASKSGEVYLTKNTATTVAGCWQICDFTQNIGDARVYFTVNYDVGPLGFTLNQTDDVGVNIPDTAYDFISNAQSDPYNALMRVFLSISNMRIPAIAWQTTDEFGSPIVLGFASWNMTQVGEEMTDVMLFSTYRMYIPDTVDITYTLTVNPFDSEEIFRLTYVDNTAEAEAMEIRLSEIEGGVSEVSNNLITHSANTTKHITSAERTSWNSASANSHTHSNKSTLDSITSTVKSGYDTASSWVSTNGANTVSHLSDAVRHITHAERTAWDGKADASHTHTDTEITMSGYTGNLREAYTYVEGQALAATQAAENATTIASSKLSDAPSDNKQYARKNGAWAEVQSSGGNYLPLTGGTLTGETIFNTVYRDTYTAHNLCSLRQGGTAYETVIKTKIKFVGSSYMPVMHIYGMEYRTLAPVELRICFYVYSGAFYNPRVYSTGGWVPTVRVFTYNEGGVDYIAVGLIGESYYLGYQVDLSIPTQGSWGTNILTSGWTTVANTSSSTSIIPEIGTDNCKLVDAKPILSQVKPNSSTEYLPFVDSYTSSFNTWFTNGYTKISATATTGHPPQCTDSGSKWGVLFFIAENATNGTGTQMYFPIDGNYKGRIFYRSCKNKSFEAWNLIPTKLSELTNDLYSYGTADPSTIANPVEGQIYFKLSE